MSEKQIGSESADLKFELVKKEKLYTGFFQLNRYLIRHQLFRGGWSRLFGREVFERGRSAAVILFDPVREDLVFVEQFRPGAIESESSPWVLELVAGMIETGEEPEAVVVRESFEEVGCQVGRVMKICDYLVSPGGTTERIWLFLGEVDSQNMAAHGGVAGENEDIKVHRLPAQLMFDRLESGKINNAMTLIAVQWLKLNWQNRADFWSK